MSRRRLVLVLAPWAFLAFSVLLTRWVRTPSPPTCSPNEIDHARVTEVASLSVIGPISDGLRAATRRREAELVAALGPECRVWSAAPFVLAGDLDEAGLRRLYRRTILPATRALIGEYFDRLPDEPITLLVFTDRRAYEEHAERLFGDRHLSVYGYYRPRERTVVANLATGSGTLVHELTHALMDFDFPHAPVWFQEGFASLHEHGEFVVERGEYVLRGRPNWRRLDLDMSGRTGSLESLLTRTDLRGADELQAYATSRQLCLYLQDLGVLSSCYRRMRDGHADASGAWGPASDPYGILALRSALADESLGRIEARFLEWTLSSAQLANPSAPAG